MASWIRRSESSLIDRSRSAGKFWLRREGQRSHLDRRVLQRDPRGDRQLAAQRPVVLVNVPGRDAAAGLLVQGLVVVQAHALGPQHLGGDLRQPSGKDELARDLALRPDVRDLQERLVIGRALLERQVHSVELDDLGSDLLAVALEGLGGEHVVQMDEAVMAETLDGVLGELIGGIQFGGEHAAMIAPARSDRTSSPTAAG
jgi:hypothetical protein